MILRGPGAESYGEYPADDVEVYDEIGKTGEQMLPFYRYMVIWKDLYTVHGGFVNWAYEGLGIFAFTNEMWNTPQYSGGRTDAERTRRTGSSGTIASSWGVVRRVAPVQAPALRRHRDRRREEGPRAASRRLSCSRSSATATWRSRSIHAGEMPKLEWDPPK